MYNNTINLIGLKDPEKEKEEKAERLKSSVERKNTNNEKLYNKFVKSIKYKKSKSKKK
jgi:predicted RNA-binding protein with RPS1 domain